MSYIATPESYTFSKLSTGISDVTVNNSVYKFMRMQRIVCVYELRF